jgi:hypothetical protein
MSSEFFGLRGPFYNGGFGLFFSLGSIGLMLKPALSDGLLLYLLSNLQDFRSAAGLHRHNAGWELSKKSST